MRWTTQPATTRLAVVLAAVVVATTPLPSAGAPVRSGTILSGSGWFLEYSLGGCQSTPECAAWLESGCDTALAGRDPGFMASIVSVRELADGRTRRTFRHTDGEPAALRWGGSPVVQFWRSDCSEIVTSRLRTNPCDAYECKATTLRVPRNARWMTVTSYQDNVNLRWTLT